MTTYGATPDDNTDDLSAFNACVSAAVAQGKSVYIPAGRFNLGNMWVIGSVANYFKAFNWQPGMPTHYPVSFDNSRLDMNALMAPDILPTFSVASFTAKGAVLDGAALQHTGQLAMPTLLKRLRARINKRSHGSCWVLSHSVHAAPIRLASTTIPMRT